jgi:thioester reductase-like protein
MSFFRPLPMPSILDHLKNWTTLCPDRLLFAFLDASGNAQESYSFAAFDRATARLARHLAEEAGLRHGDRVLLAYPPGLRMIEAFYACLRLGVIPAPVCAPRTHSHRSGLDRLYFIAHDCDAQAILSTGAQAQSAQHLVAQGNGFRIPWVATDQVADDVPEWTDDRPHEILFLQYTSGSTGDPKGVIVTQQNVLANCQSLLRHRPIGVSWLPQYHDMGLIGHYLFGVITGGTNYGFAPADFLRNPVLWLQTISRYQATITTAPNFAYEYCLRPDKVSDEVIASLDLSSIRLMMNGAEPVRPETFERFRDRFGACGLRSETFVAAYGLAENTLAVSLGGRQALTINKERLQNRELRIEKAQPANNNQLRLMSAGKPLPGIQVRLVDPETRSPLGEGRIGEIWVAGDSKCAGYWAKPERTRETIEASIRGESKGPCRYLRTGDLGFLHEGELFVCGRVKDMIIIRGVNYYPQDIEAIVESSFPQIAKGGASRTAAFAVDDGGEEKLVVAIEIRNQRQLPDAKAIVRRIRAQYFIEPYHVLFVPPHTIARTTSGKIARNETRERWLAGQLPVLATHTRNGHASAPRGELREMFFHIQELYDLQGDEQITFAEIGMDSLTMMELLLRLQDFLKERNAGELADAVDARFLQRLKVAELFTLISEFEARTDLPLDTAQQLLSAMQQEHDARESTQMRADAQYTLPKKVPAPIFPKSPGTYSRVLLTGPTGFFGPFLLDSLLQQTEAEIVTLVRAADPEHGRDRLQAALERAGLGSADLKQTLRRRVRVVCGDLARKRLGLADEAWHDLGRDVDAILHNGARVNYVLSYDALRTHNVEGTRQLLDLACAGKPKPFHFVSSTFIYGWSTKKILWEADNHPDMTNLDFGYAQSKWTAEQMIHSAAAQGLPARIYRPSLITPTAGGAGSRDDIAVRVLAFMIKYGIAPRARNQLSFIPADVAAGNIVAILNDDSAGPTCHITADEYYSIIDVAQVITDEFGYSFDYIPIVKFVEEMNRLCRKEDLLYPLRSFFTRSYPKIVAMRDKRYDNRTYQAARRKAGDLHVEPGLADTVTWLVQFMLKEGLIPRPERRTRQRAISAVD